MIFSYQKIIGLGPPVIPLILRELQKQIGFEECETGELEREFEKVALYGFGLMYTHAARQLADGQWTSKLEQLEDITHETPDVIAGSDNGEVVQFMRRPINNCEQPQ